jgi:hypothetical protein
MTNAYNMVNIAQGKLQQLVCQYTPSICKAKQAMVCEYGPQSHSPRVQYGLMAQATKTGMSMYDLDALANHDVAKDGKERENGWEGGLAVDDPEWNVVDFETVG